MSVWVKSTFRQLYCNNFVFAANSMHLLSLHNMSNDLLKSHIFLWSFISPAIKTLQYSLVKSNGSLNKLNCGFIMGLNPFCHIASVTKASFRSCSNMRNLNSSIVIIMIEASNQRGSMQVCYQCSSGMILTFFQLTKD